MRLKGMLLVCGGIALSIALAAAFMLGVGSPGPWTTEMPEAYAPVAGARYLYAGYYPDGTVMETEVLTIRVPSGPLLSLVEVPQESEPFASHLVRREDGLYTVWERDPGTDFLYLPEPTVSGTGWLDGEVVGQILKTGETVDLGFAVFNDCILVVREYSDTGWRINSWYAPGVGLVRSEYSDTGALQEVLVAKGSLGLMERLWVLGRVPGAWTVR